MFFRSILRYNNGPSYAALSQEDKSLILIGLPNLSKPHLEEFAKYFKVVHQFISNVFVVTFSCYGEIERKHSAIHISSTFSSVNL